MMATSTYETSVPLAPFEEAVLAGAGDMTEGVRASRGLRGVCSVCASAYESCAAGKKDESGRCLLAQEIEDRWAFRSASSGPANSLPRGLPRPRRVSSSACMHARE